MVHSLASSPPLHCSYSPPPFPSHTPLPPPPSFNASLSLLLHPPSMSSHTRRRRGRADNTSTHPPGGQGNTSGAPCDNVREEIYNNPGTPASAGLATRRQEMYAAAEQATLRQRGLLSVISVHLAAPVYNQGSGGAAAAASRLLSVGSVASRYRTYGRPTQLLSHACNLQPILRNMKP